MVMPNIHSQLDAAAGAGPEEGCRPTILPAPAAASPELSVQPKRPIFSAATKLRILAETDRAADTGGIAAVLRREGLYLSALTDWRRQRDAGAYAALKPLRRGPSSAVPKPVNAELAKGDLRHLARRGHLQVFDPHHVSHPGYRILAEHSAIRERRNQLRHRVHQKPELLAEAPTRSGLGTSPSSWERPSGPTS